MRLWTSGYRDPGARRASRAAGKARRAALARYLAEIEATRWRTDGATSAGGAWTGDWSGSAFEWGTEDGARMLLVPIGASVEYGAGPGRTITRIA